MVPLGWVLGSLRPLKASKEFPLAALHAATAVPFSDLKEACAVFQQYAHSDSQDHLLPSSQTR